MSIISVPMKLDVAERTVFPLAAVEAETSLCPPTPEIFVLLGKTHVLEIGMLPAGSRMVVGGGEALPGRPSKGDPVQAILVVVVELGSGLYSPRASITAPLG